MGSFPYFYGRPEVRQVTPYFLQKLAPGLVFFARSEIDILYIVR